MLKDIRKGIHNLNYEMTLEQYNNYARANHLKKAVVDTEEEFNDLKKQAVEEKMEGLDWGYPERAFCTECRFFGNCNIKFKDCPYRDKLDSYFIDPYFD
ncbi:MAG: hypothetical protein ACLFPS_09110 [Clostridia bacterium]